MQQVGGYRAQNSERINAIVRIEAAVFDGEKSFRQIERQLAQRHGRAAHFSARREHPSVEPHDLDRGRALRNFERLDRRQVRGDPSDHANGADKAPQTDHQRPVRGAPDERAARPLARFLFTRAGSGFARGIVESRLLPLFALTPGHTRPWISGARYGARFNVRLSIPARPKRQNKTWRRGHNRTIDG